MQEEVDQKTIALAVKTGKLTAQVLQAAIQKYLAARQKGTGKARHGQQNLRQLKKDGSALSNIEITDANIGLFKPCAKKYDIDFTLRKDRTTHPPRYIVIFKSKQADNLEQAVSYTHLCMSCSKARSLPEVKYIGGRLLSGFGRKKAAS